MVPDERVIQKINEHLEPQIRVFGKLKSDVFNLILSFCSIVYNMISYFLALKQVTRIFNCESGCSSKTYKYLLPTFAFAPTYAVRLINETNNQ